MHRAPLHRVIVEAAEWQKTVPIGQIETNFLVALSHRGV